MKRKFNFGFFLFLILSISGCSSLIYNDQKAPSYKSTTDKKRGIASNNEAPAVLNSGEAIKSIEKPSGNDVAIVSSSTNPYEDINSTGVNGAASENIELDPRFNEGLINQENNTENRVDNSADDFVDPRIRNGQEVLDSYSVTIRPDSSLEAEEVYTERAEQNRNSQNRNSLEEDTKSSSASRSSSVTETTNNNTSTSTVKEDVNNASNSDSNLADKSKGDVTTLSAVDSLLSEAQQAVLAGDYEKASSALERAHRIDPTNAKILYDISQIKYVQGNYSQAESFAGKAANLSKDKELSKKTWTLISDARRAQGNESGAELAAKRAKNY